jgi:hypothetical protein
MLSGNRTADEVHPDNYPAASDISHPLASVGAIAMVDHPAPEMFECAIVCGLKSGLLMACLVAHTKSSKSSLHR